MMEREIESTLSKPEAPLGTMSDAVGVMRSQGAYIHRGYESDLKSRIYGSNDFLYSCEMSLTLDGSI